MPGGGGSRGRRWREQPPKNAAPAPASARQRQAAEYRIVSERFEKEPESPMASMSSLDAEDLFRAISSLYTDGLKPYGRIIRKRLAEGERAAGRRPRDLGLKQLRAVCEACSPWLFVQVEDGGDWSALLQGHPATFVDVHSPCDVYPQALWDAAAEYFETLRGKNSALPGGRYACARVLMDRGLPFLAGRSLGEVSHIVQLAISEKKLLGYRNSTIVAYACSQSKAKEMCAARQKPFAALAHEGRPVATWDAVRSGLKDLLEGLAPDQEGFPLSNIKRLFRITHDIDLSETALGYAKLSELLQDSRLSDLCVVRLQEQGYFVARKAFGVGAHGSAGVGAHDHGATSDSSTCTPAQNSVFSAPMHPADSEPCKVGLPPTSALRERARGVRPLQLEEVSPASSPMSLPLPAPVSCCSVSSLVRPTDAGEGESGTFEFFPATPQPWSPRAMYPEAPNGFEAQQELPRLLGSALNRGLPHFYAPEQPLGAAACAADLGVGRTGDLARTFLDLLRAPMLTQAPSGHAGPLVGSDGFATDKFVAAGSAHAGQANPMAYHEASASQAQAPSSQVQTNFQPRQSSQPLRLHAPPTQLQPTQQQQQQDRGRMQQMQQGCLASQPPLTPSKLGNLGLRVQNTFINTAAPPLLVSPTGEPRSSSLPRKWKM